MKSTGVAGLRIRRPGSVGGGLAIGGVARRLRVGEPDLDALWERRRLEVQRRSAEPGVVLGPPSAPADLWGSKRGISALAVCSKKGLLPLARWGVCLSRERTNDPSFSQ